MKLPSLKKILREDLKDAPDWINPVIDVTNNFMENLYGGLNKNITLTENVACFVKEITYQTPSTYPVMGVVTFRNTLKTKPYGLVVLQVFNKETYEPAAGPCYAPWVEVNNEIRVYPVTGLLADKTYTIRFLVT